MVQPSTILTVLDNDRQFASELPKYTVVSASAGSGKTRALKQRYTQLLLSRSIPNNALKNILAITFTNNAAREMKQRVLDSLKSASLGKPETLEELQTLLTLTSSEIQLAASRLVEDILDNYSDFQIRTIDSFLSRVFKASALELGLSPDVDIVLESDTLLDDAFDLFARDLSEGTDSALLLGELLELLAESRGADERFLWNPYPELASNVKNLYKRFILTSKSVRRENYSAEIRELGDTLIAHVLSLDALVSRPHLAKTVRFEAYVEYAKAGDVARLVDHKVPSPPVKKSESTPEVYQRAIRECDEICSSILAIRKQLILLGARQHFQPYGDAHSILTRSIDRIKRERGQLDIGDLIKRLAEYLKPGTVPEIYYSLGETLTHYLIDEFQDTNPIQWETLQPLIENALAVKGSLFVVGDTKQSIYGFRGADWRIMKRLQTEDVFPSALKDLRTLRTNYRSFEKILRFNDEVFKTIVPGKVGVTAAEASGLSTDEQRVRDSFAGKGVVEIATIPADIAAEEIPQKAKLLDAVTGCLARGYRASDITILSPRNSDIIEISGWLNERGISFISHSSLDVRSRKVTGELLALLQFLDSPIDDLSYGTFLLGDLFEALLRHNHSPLQRPQVLEFLFQHRIAHRHQHPLYVTFRQTYPDLWHRSFEELFTVVGYLPLYDLVSEVYKTFDVFRILPEEEATLAKILEVVKNFEEKGENSLKAFLQFAADSTEDADWNIDIPTDVDAVKVMTIHKAKGLESKVVVVLLYDSSPRRESLFLEEDRDEVRLVHLTKDAASEVNELQELYDQKVLSQTVDDLNKLYVALTRAEEEMVIISVKAKRGTTPSDFLPQSGYEEGEKPVVHRRPTVTEERVALCHDLPRTPPHPTQYTGISVAETRRGAFVHAMLESVVILEKDPDKILQQAAQRATTRIQFDQNIADLVTTVAEALRLPEISPYFQQREGRTIMNEQEFAAPDGTLVRMDRVVVDRDIVTVIDYKTGDEKPEYREQVATYMKILRNFYRDRPVDGVLLYIDRQRLQRLA